MTDFEGDVDEIDTHVKHEPEHSRFTLYFGDEPIGEVDYVEEDGELIITHTGVREEYRTAGRASQATEAALHYAVEHDLAVVPECPFTAWYLQKHDVPGLVLA